MNVGPSDIIQGLKALEWIWQNGFVHENSRGEFEERAKS